jgi:hypothetical protein
MLAPDIVRDLNLYLLLLVPSRPYVATNANSYRRRGPVRPLQHAPHLGCSEEARSPGNPISGIPAAGGGTFLLQHHERPALRDTPSGGARFGGFSLLGESALLHVVA